jgi:hypothetical protein
MAKVSVFAFASIRQDASGLLRESSNKNVKVRGFVPEQRRFMPKT